MQHPRVGVEDRTGARHCGNLHTRAESGVEPDDDALSRRRGEKQLLQIATEDRDRLLVRARLELEPQLHLDGEREQPLVCVARDQLELRERTTPRGNACDEPGENLLDRCGHRPREDTLFLAAADGQHAMRRDAAEWLGKIVVVLELGDVLLLSRHCARRHAALAAREIAHPTAQIGVLGDALAENVTRAGERVIDGGHFTLGADELRRLRQRGGIVHVAGPDRVGERLEPTLARDDRPRSPLRLEGKVEILERLLRGDHVEPRRELGGHLALLVDRLADGDAAVAELAEILRALLNGAKLRLVETAGRLLSVAGDEGQRVALGKHLEGGGDLPGLEGELLRNGGGDV